MNKRIYNVLGLIVLSAFMVTAGLVSVISNNVTVNGHSDVPLNITINGAFSNTVNGAHSYTPNSASFSLYGGESMTIQSVLKNLANVDTSGFLTQVKIIGTNASVNDFVNSSLYYQDNAWSGNVPLCQNGGVIYAYIGPTTGTTIPALASLESNVTATLKSNAVGDYQADVSSVILSQRQC